MLLHVLGITEWFCIHQAVGCIGIEAALQRLNTFITSLYSIESIDEDELESSRCLGQKMARLLAYTTVPSLNLSPAGGSTDIAGILRENPLLNTEWLSPEERTAYVESIEGVHSSQKE